MGMCNSIDGNHSNNYVMLCFVVFSSALICYFDLYCCFAVLYSVVLSRAELICFIPTVVLLCSAVLFSFVLCCFSVLFCCYILLNFFSSINLLFPPPPPLTKTKSLANINELSRSVENCKIYYLKEKWTLNCTLRSLLCKLISFIVFFACFTLFFLLQWKKEPMELWTELWTVYP